MLDCSIREYDSELARVIGFLAQCLLDAFPHPVSIIRVDPLALNSVAGKALQRIKSPNTVTLLGPIDVPLRCPVEDPGTGVTEPLCLRQIGFAAAQFGGAFGHLHLKLVTGLTKLSLAVAQRSLGASVILDEACHPKCRRGMIGRHGEQELVDFPGKVGAITRRANQTELGIDADGNDNAATRSRAVADAWDTFVVQERTALGEARPQPFQKRRPWFSSRSLDGGSVFRIAQPHEGGIHIQRIDQQVGKISGDGRWFSSYPRYRDARQRHEIPEQPSETENVRIGMRGHLSGCNPLRPRQSALPYLEKEFVRWNEKRILPEQPADNDERVRSHDIHRHAGADFG